jgi:2-oxoacid:acceptor oxidoreductase gamma subunit (pyruvate/2-ketoisovalerate family)
LEPLNLQDCLRDSVLEIRGDGKAGGGLVLTFQSLANLLLGNPLYHVQEWPFFSSARRGANIRSFLRASRKPIQAACEVTRPSLSLLLDEGAARSADFAQGVPAGGTFLLNTRHTPEECARRYRLSGRVITVPGDDIGTKYLKRSIGNVSAYVALARAIGAFSEEEIVNSFLASLRKRHIPEPLVDANREALLASFDAFREDVFDEAGPEDHLPSLGTGYGDLPIGAQTQLRLSQANLTANYSPSGFRLQFADPETACTGCAHCITNCPENVIHFRPDEERGLLVTGVNVTSYCKLCGECISVCPEHLFSQVPYEEPWEVTNS